MRSRRSPPLFAASWLVLNPRHGRVVAGVGWFDTDYLGIDQGPIIAMIENYRTELIWKTMRTNKYIVAGLKKAGFTGGWLGNSASEANKTCGCQRAGAIR
jgi:hypothetical protein